MKIEGTIPNFLYLRKWANQMSIFDLRQSVIDEYSKYIQSFLSIANERVRSFIEESLLNL